MESAKQYPFPFSASYGVWVFLHFPGYLSPCTHLPWPSPPPSPYRFPDGFEKFSPPILQLDEVDFSYNPSHCIFRGLSVSADLESRICVVCTGDLAFKLAWGSKRML